MLGYERRWANAVLEAFAPVGGPGLAPREGEVDYVGAFRTMARESTHLAALGMRIALYLIALAPLWMWGRVTTAARLAVGERSQLLSQLITHRSFAVRELTTLLKLTASFALLGTRTVRARSNYDRGVAPRADYDGVEQSGERPRVRKLPIAGAPGIGEVA